MTLAEAEADKRFDAFKIMGMLELGLYIAKCNKYLSTHPNDPEILELKEAAVLINNSRIGVKA